jgi:6-phosphogluconate dehydrogenase
LEEKGIHFVGCGVSGGEEGALKGPSLMPGGSRESWKMIAPIFRKIAAQVDGEPCCRYMGPDGAGHYVKMVHNGIEYGMLQAYAEGFAIMQAKQDFGELDLHAIAHLWNQGSVVRSWLLELAERAFERDPQLDQLRGWVDDSGEGRWTFEEAMQLSVPAPVLAQSLIARYQSRLPDGFGNKVIAALRNEFGGHAVKAETAAGTPSSH